MGKQKNDKINNKLILYPTDTVYGIGGNALEEIVIKRIHELKGSDNSKPFSVIMADIKMVKEYCDISKEEEKILRKYLPGPYTFILKMKKNIPCGKNGTIGVRIPKDSKIVEICKKWNVPIIKKSGNFHKDKPPTKFEEIPKEILDSADEIIKGNVSGEESTIVDIVNKKIIRKGKWEFSF